MFHYLFRDIQSSETILERQRQLTEQIHKSPQGFLREADDFLERIESRKSKLRPQFMVSILIYYFITNLIEILS